MFDLKSFSRIDLLALVILCLTTFFMNSDSGIISPNLSKIASDFDLSEHERDVKVGGELSFISSITAGFASIVVGWLSANNWDTCNLLIFVILVGKIPALFAPIVSSFGHLVVLRIFDGILNGSGFPLVLALTAETFKVSKRNLLAGAVHLFYGLGASVGLTSIAFFSESIDWKLFFVVTAIPSILTALTLKIFRQQILKIQDDQYPYHKERGLIPEKNSSNNFSIRLYLSKVSKVICVQTNFFCYLISISACAYWGMNGTFVIDYIRERGLSVQGGSTLMLVFGLCVKVGAVTGGFLAQYLHNKRPEIFAQGFALIRFCSLVPLLIMLNYDYENQAHALKSSKWPDLYIFCVCAAGGWMAGMPGPQVGATIMNATPANLRPLALTLLVLTDSTGGAIGPMLAGYLMPSFGRKAVLNFCTLFWWSLSGTCFLAMSRFIRSDVKRATQKSENILSAV